VDGLWATQSEGIGLIVRAINFQDFQRTPGEYHWSISVIYDLHESESIASRTSFTLMFLFLSNFISYLEQRLAAKDHRVDHVVPYGRHFTDFSSSWLNLSIVVRSKKSKNGRGPFGFVISQHCEC